MARKRVKKIVRKVRKIKVHKNAKKRHPVHLKNANKRRHKAHLKHGKRARIKSKRIKSVKIIRISSGIKNFDKLIKGGFEKESTNIIVGATGSAKSIIATQFLIEGLRKGEKCMYVTFEERKSQFFQNMIEFGWDL